MSVKGGTILFVNRVFAVLACVAAVLLIEVAPAAADPAPDLPAGPVLSQANWPNDPNFARCELQDPVSGCTDSEQWNLYGPMDGQCLAPGGAVFDQPRPDGGLPCWARNATDPESSSGINMTGAWAQGNIGRDDILIAYVEGGVNYSSNGVKDGLDAIYLNRRELPYPQGWDGQDLGRYDFDGNNEFDIRDYAKDPRVNPPCPGATPQFTTYEEGTTRGCAENGTHEYIHQVNIGGPLTKYLSPDDLIAVFGHCKITDSRVASCPADGRFDNDGNGYPNDISGWNAYQNTNDPQTEDRAYGHASGLIGEMGGEANNNFAGVGNCRNCRIVPVKSGAESVGKADGLAPAITYATDLGVDAMSTVVVSYAYSSAVREAVKYAVEQKGILMSMDSNDFDSMDHTDGHLFDDVFPGNGLAQDVEGKDVKSFRARSNVTSYGTHSIFSGGETTTSGATPFQAAFLGMVQSAALNAVDEPTNPYKRRLTPNEVKQVLINTASEILPQRDHAGVARQWPGNPDSKTDSTHTAWSTQYGYGRPNIGKATKLIMDGKVPPTADIDSPGWYKYVDPTKGGKLQVKGKVAPSAWGSNGLAWTLEWAVGANPGDDDFQTLSTGKEAKSGVLGTLNLSDIPAAYAKADPAANVLPPDGPEQYTVTLRLRARDGNGLKGEDRRSIGARADKDLVQGFPKSIGTEMSAAPAFVDLTGKRQLDLVFGTMDGQVSALAPDGSQAPGFPVYTWKLRDIDPRNPQNFDSEAYKEVGALRDARDPISGIAVGDLDGNGAQSIIATTTSGWIYAWSANGKLRSGFPVHGSDQYNTLPVPTPDSGCRRCRLPIRGNWSAPVLGNLQGNGKLDILMSSYDGHVYAFQANGSAVPGWPVKVQLPQSMQDEIGSGYIHDPKLMMSPAVGDVLGTGTDQVFLPSFECDDDSSKTFAYGIQSDGNNHAGGAYLPGWPVTMSSIAGCYSQSIDFVQEGANAASIGDFDGSGQLRVAITPAAGSPVLLNGDGSVFKAMQPTCPSKACKGYPPYYASDAITVGVTSQSAIGDLNGDGKPEFMQPVAGGVTLTTAFGDAGQAALAHVFDQAWDPLTGKTLDNFPTNQDGFPFYSSPVVANLTDDGNRSMVAANDSYWIHARGPDGQEAPGFPKWTGQWTSFGGAVGDPKLNGQQYLAYGTREGQVFLWKVGGKPSMNDQWWHFRHDEHNSGRYGNDTRPPAGVKFVVKRSKKSAQITWKASGDDGVSGAKVAKVQVYKSKKKISLAQLGSRLKSPKIAKPGGNQKVRVKLAPKKSLYIAVRQQDADGNWSSLSRFKVKPFKKFNLKKQKKICRKKFKTRGKHGAAKRKAKKKQKNCIKKAVKKSKKIKKKNTQRS
ncbi:MAG: hypothetical protein J0H66_01405 [Solirubrobacterales bacterium]|nr:hypothetical protein [Solirubrobacterales bacterium]